MTGRRARVRVKVCCMSSGDECALAVEAGADAVGFVSAMPSGAGMVGEELIAGIAPLVPPPVATFLLTSSLDPAVIAAQQRRCGTNTIQLVDSVGPSCLASLREDLPGVRLVQVIHVVDDSSVEEAKQIAHLVDAILLDSGNPRLPVKELGGTGRTHDWTLSRRIRKESKVPVYLAGGLNASNVRDAIRLVEPFAVDVCSGVRTGGMLDRDKLYNFMSAVSE